MTYLVHGIASTASLRRGGLTREEADRLALQFIREHEEGVAEVVEIKTGQRVGIYGPKQKPLPVSRNFEQRTR